MRVKFSLTFLLVFLPLTLQADGLNLCGYLPFLYFANGMRNERDEAEDSLRTLKFLLQKKLQGENQIHWDPSDSELAYDFYSDTYTQLVEVVQQKRGEQMREFWEWYYDYSQTCHSFIRLQSGHCGLEKNHSRRRVCLYCGNAQ